MAQPAATPTGADPTPEPPSDVRGVDARGREDQAWLDGMDALLAEIPPMTDEERRRDALMGRLACALEIMSDQGLDPARIDKAIGWPLRHDFEQLLDAWEVAAPARGTA